MSEWVLDSSAILALLNEEAGAEEVAGVLSHEICLLSCVNAAEVVSRLTERGVPVTEAEMILLNLNLNRVDFDFATACRCGALRPVTRALGLSLGDRACLALAIEHSGSVMTADRAWAGLDVGVEIRVIR